MFSPPSPCDSPGLITCSRCCRCPTQTPVSRLAPHPLVQGTKDWPSCLQGGQTCSASPTPELLLCLSRTSSLPGLSAPHLFCFLHILRDVSLERTPSKIIRARIPWSGFAPRKPHVSSPVIWEVTLRRGEPPVLPPGRQPQRSQSRKVCRPN